ncbi:hypothetical protein HDU85_002082 [Gaertneriomyces sp. JEL0708]|nr:hypothetical protein HDU85_002082 [Gaertneriomyces sp. JEL0708]
MVTANSEVLRALELHGIKPSSTKSTEIGGGCVNGAFKYETSEGPVFVKINQNATVDPVTMFVGEATSLQHILAATTSYGVSFAPMPLFHGPLSQGAFLTTSYIPLTAPTKRHQVELARRLATMHSSDPPPDCVGLGFGFPVPTMLGTTHQDNTWDLDWVSFYRKRFKAMIDKVLSNYPQDFELQRLGDAVCAKMPEFFAGCDEIKPSLIHGDLWSGNWGVNSETDLPVIFDPACCYVRVDVL